MGWLLQWRMLTVNSGNFMTTILAMGTTGVQKIWNWILISLENYVGFCYKLFVITCNNFDGARETCNIRCIISKWMHLIGLDNAEFGSYSFWLIFLLLLFMHPHICYRNFAWNCCAESPVEGSAVVFGGQDPVGISGHKLRHFKRPRKVALWHCARTTLVYKTLRTE